MLGAEDASRIARQKSRVLLVALQKLDRDSLRAADETDAHAGADRCRLLGELDALGLDLGCDRVDVFHRQPKMVEPLIGRHGRGIDAAARLDLGNEHVGAAELDIDPVRSADDDAAQDVLKPCRGRLRVGAAQMDMIPGDDWHGWLSRWFLRVACLPTSVCWPRQSCAAL